jgi:hypothetical protein
MSKLTIKFFELSSTPSVLVDGAFGDHLLLEFIQSELQGPEACRHYLDELREQSQAPSCDLGFGNAVAVYLEDGHATLEHVVPSIPPYSLPVTLLIEIVECWSEAMATRSDKFTACTFEIP